MKMESSVMFLRLVTGEDIIADATQVETDKESYYLLNNPLKVVYMTGSKPGYLSISLMQWIFWRICDKQEFTLHAQDVMTSSVTSDSMEDYYWTSVEHFYSSKEKMSEQTQFEESTYEEDEDQNELLQNIIEELKNITPKRKLH